MFVGCCKGSVPVFAIKSIVSVVIERGVIFGVEVAALYLVFLFHFIQCLRVAVVLLAVDGLLDGIQFRPPVAVFQKPVLVCVVKHKRILPLPPDHAEGHLFECRRVAALH
jgi:hypothetical protein